MAKNNEIKIKKEVQGVPFTFRRIVWRGTFTPVPRMKCPNCK